MQPADFTDIEPDEMAEMALLDGEAVPFRTS